MKTSCIYNECSIELNVISKHHELISKTLVPGSDDSIQQDFTKYEEPQQEKACKGLLTCSV